MAIREIVRRIRLFLIGDRRRQCIQPAIERRRWCSKGVKGSQRDMYDAIDRFSETIRVKTDEISRRL